ncbi:putative mfs multidrug transporter protein [Eutypa lata UCREL1]|uniref:Putative mfs multidrug transporter protein n=1 Tax=Eutypa lata (strain UCR-EL1) TaxID=1287681 RepID=M7SJZ2_EUTLA|nr:putative mfs multidrug transporter protein [Eutypa lata UCREL1]
MADQSFAASTDSVKEAAGFVQPGELDEIAAFAPGDPENPFNWSSRKKGFIVFVGIIAILNSTFDSSLPSGAIDFITDEFNVADPVQHALPISVYLVGYILGPLLFSPLSETYGRRIIMVPSFALFTIFTLACALAPDWPSFLFFRLVCGINASSSIAITSGIYADIYADPVVRGRAIAFSLYLAFASAIYFLLFEAYPIIFQGIYKMNYVEAGLAFIPIAVGSILAFFISMAWDAYFRRARKHQRPFTGIKEYERLPLACVGAICYVVSIFWIGWSASPNIHWIVPMLSGVPFGIGFVLIFIALLNYMTDAYREYAASAAAAASCTRSIFGALLPLAGTAMYGRLGVSWGFAVEKGKATIGNFPLA